MAEKGRKSKGRFVIKRYMGQISREEVLYRILRLLMDEKQP